MSDYMLDLTMVSTSQWIELADFIVQENGDSNAKLIHIKKKFKTPTDKMSGDSLVVNLFVGWTETDGRYIEMNFELDTGGETDDYTSRLSKFWRNKIILPLLDGRTTKQLL